MVEIHPSYELEDLGVPVYRRINSADQKIDFGRIANCIYYLEYLYSASSSYLEGGWEYQAPGASAEAGYAFG